MDLPDWLLAASARAPLYASVPKRPTWPSHSHTIEDLEALATARHDSFAGRRDPAGPMQALVQATRDQPIYWALGRPDLNALAKMLADCWTRLGIVAGEAIALYDYATSPVVLYASRSYVPYLDAGAADLLGCVPICNDGLPDLADRCAHLVEYVQPSVLFVDAQALDPLARALQRKRLRSVPRVVISADEAPAGRAELERWSAVLGTEVRQMLRSDAALFLAPPCPVVPMTFHPDPGAYRIEALADGTAGDLPRRLTVTNLAIRSSVVIRYVTGVDADVRAQPCRCGFAGPSVIIRDAHERR